MNFRRALLFACLLALVKAAWAETETYQIDADISKPQFEVPHLGFTTLGGRFNVAEGSITLDRAAQRGSVLFKVKSASIDMGSPGWDAHLRDPGLLNVLLFPEIKFQSSRLEFSGEKVIAAQGELSMLGITKPLRITVEGFRCGVSPINQKKVCGATVLAKVSRSAFGLTRYIPEVSDQVNLRIPVEAYRQ